MIWHCFFVLDSKFSFMLWSTFLIWVSVLFGKFWVLKVFCLILYIVDDICVFVIMDSVFVFYLFIFIFIDTGEKWRTFCSMELYMSPSMKWIILKVVVVEAFFVRYKRTIPIFFSWFLFMNRDCILWADFTVWFGSWLLVSGCSPFCILLLRCHFLP